MSFNINLTTGLQDLSPNPLGNVTYSFPTTNPPKPAFATATPKPTAAPTPPAHPSISETLKATEELLKAYENFCSIRSEYAGSGDPLEHPLTSLCDNAIARIRRALESLQEQRADTKEHRDC